MQRIWSSFPDSDKKGVRKEREGRKKGGVFNLKGRGRGGPKMIGTRRWARVAGREGTGQLAAEETDRQAWFTAASERSGHAPRVLEGRRRVMIRRERRARSGVRLADGEG